MLPSKVSVLALRPVLMLVVAPDKPLVPVDVPFVVPKPVVPTPVVPRPVVPVVAPVLARLLPVPTLMLVPPLPLRCIDGDSPSTGNSCPRASSTSAVACR